MNKKSKTNKKSNTGETKPNATIEASPFVLRPARPDEEASSVANTITPHTSQGQDNTGQGGANYNYGGLLDCFVWYFLPSPLLVPAPVPVFVSLTRLRA